MYLCCCAFLDFGSMNEIQVIASGRQDLRICSRTPSTWVMDDSLWGHLHTTLNFLSHYVLNTALSLKKGICRDVGPIRHEYSEVKPKGEKRGEDMKRT
jgi:hypothetical protein